MTKQTEVQYIARNTIHVGIAFVIDGERAKNIFVYGNTKAACNKAFLAELKVISSEINATGLKERWAELMTD